MDHPRASAQPAQPTLSPIADGTLSLKRALLVKFGAIGDVVMAIPAAAALHASGYRIDWVASEAVAPLLALYPWIHVVPVNEPELLRGSVGVRLRIALSLQKQLRQRVAGQGAYDLLATLYYDRRYRWLTAFVPARRRLCLSNTDRRYMLLPGRHHADEYARILSGRADGEHPTQLAPVSPPQIPPPAHPPKESQPRVVLVPAGARNALRDDALRRWPIELYVTLAEQLLHQGLEVVLAGGPGDRWASGCFADLAQRYGLERFSDLIGALSLVETLALFHSADVTVTHDTGPLHMAGLTGTGIVSVFGPTDPHGRLPHRAGTVALWGGEDFACRPCYDGREYAPCQHNGCMSQVTPALVLHEVRTLLEAKSSGRRLPPRIIAPQSSVLTEIARGVAP